MLVVNNWRKAAPVLHCGLVVLVIVLSFGVATVLVSSQLFHTEMLNLGDFGLARHLDGSVHRPFAYRVLTDWLVRKGLGINLQLIIVPRLEPIVQLACKSQLASPPATCDQIRVYAIVATAFAWGYLIITYLAARKVVGGHLWGGIALAIGALSVNSLLLQRDGQPYDFVVLFFSALLFVLAERQRDIWFSCVFIIACFVKESLALFALVYVCISFHRRPLPGIALRLVLQLAAFTIIYSGERIAFRNNAGAPMYHNLSGHLQYLANTLNLSSLLALILFIFLLLYRIPDKPHVLRRGMLVLPLLFILYIAGGNPGEFRITFELFPFILLPVVDTLKRLVCSNNYAMSGAGCDRL